MIATQILFSTLLVLATVADGAYTSDGVADLAKVTANISGTYSYPNAGNSGVWKVIPNTHSYNFLIAPTTVPGEVGWWGAAGVMVDYRACTLTSAYNSTHVNVTHSRGLANTTAGCKSCMGCPLDVLGYAPQTSQAPCPTVTCPPASTCPSCPTASPITQGPSWCPVVDSFSETVRASDPAGLTPCYPNRSRTVRFTIATGSIVLTGPPMSVSTGSTVRCVSYLNGTAFNVSTTGGPDRMGTVVYCPLGFDLTVRTACETVRINVTKGASGQRITRKPADYWWVMISIALHCGYLWLRRLIPYFATRKSTSTTIHDNLVTNVAIAPLYGLLAIAGLGLVPLRLFLLWCHATCGARATLQVSNDGRGVYKPKNVLPRAFLPVSGSTARPSAKGTKPFALPPSLISASVNANVGAYFGADVSGYSRVHFTEGVGVDHEMGVLHSGDASDASPHWTSAVTLELVSALVNFIVWLNGGPQRYRGYTSRTVWWMVVFMLLGPTWVSFADGASCAELRASVFGGDLLINGVGAARLGRVTAYPGSDGSVYYVDARNVSITATTGPSYYTPHPADVNIALYATCATPGFAYGFFPQMPMSDPGLSLEFAMTPQQCMFASNGSHINYGIISATAAGEIAIASCMVAPIGKKVRWLAISMIKPMTTSQSAQPVVYKCYNDSGAPVQATVVGFDASGLDSSYLIEESGGGGSYVVASSYVNPPGEIVSSNALGVVQHVGVAAAPAIREFANDPWLKDHSTRSPFFYYQGWSPQAINVFPVPSCEVITTQIGAYWSGVMSPVAILAWTAPHLSAIGSPATGRSTHLVLTTDQNRTLYGVNVPSLDVIAPLARNWYPGLTVETLPSCSTVSLKSVLYPSSLASWNGMFPTGAITGGSMTVCPLGLLTQSVSEMCFALATNEQYNITTTMIAPVDSPSAWVLSARDAAIGLSIRAGPAYALRFCPLEPPGGYQYAPGFVSTVGSPQMTSSLTISIPISPGWTPAPQPPGCASAVVAVSYGTDVRWVSVSVSTPSSGAFMCFGHLFNCTDGLYTIAANETSESCEAPIVASDASPVTMAPASIVTNAIGPYVVTPAPAPTMVPPPIEYKERARCGRIESGFAGFFKSIFHQVSCLYDSLTREWAQSVADMVDVADSIINRIIASFMTGLIWLGLSLAILVAILLTYKILNCLWSCSKRKQNPPKAEEAGNP